MKQCTSCQRSIHMVRSDSTGNWMPVDDEATPDGNIRLDLHRRTATVLAGDRLEKARSFGEPLHVSHFVTCPYGSKHRSRR